MEKLIAGKKAAGSAAYFKWVVEYRLHVAPSVARAIRFSSWPRAIRGVTVIAFDGLAVVNFLLILRLRRAIRI